MVRVGIIWPAFMSNKGMLKAQSIKRAIKLDSSNKDYAKEDPDLINLGDNKAATTNRLIRWVLWFDRLRR